MSDFVHFTFHQDFNIFLDKVNRNQTYTYFFEENSTVKDSIEVQGVPHTEVEWVLVNKQSVNFSYRLQNEDVVEVFSYHAGLQMPCIVRPPLSNLDFMVDFNVRKITKYLRMLGFRTVTDEGVPDEEIAAIAERENKIVLTRDIGLLKRKNVTYGYFLRSEDVEKQIVEIVKRYDLLPKIAPFSICLTCNGGIGRVTKESILEELPILIREEYDEFFQCNACQKVYWKGSHFDNMRKVIDSLQEQN